MSERIPGDREGGQPNPESSEIHELEARRQAIAVQLKTLMEEERKLIAIIDDEGSLDGLFEIIREQSSLVDQLGTIEHEITERQGVE